MENEIFLYGQIGTEITDTNFLSQLTPLKDQEVNLRINSGGGEVFQGFTMYNALKRHSLTGSVNIYVDGCAASMASVFLCLPNAKVFISENAMVMIHNPAIELFGNSKKLRQNADLLDKIQATVLNDYKQKLSIPESEIIAMLDAETWITASEAIAIGFADEIVENVFETGETIAPGELNLKAVLAIYRPKNTQIRQTTNFQKNLIISLVGVLGLPQNTSESKILEKIKKNRDELISLKVQIKTENKKESEHLTDLAITKGLIPKGFRRVQLLAFENDFYKTRTEINALILEHGLSVEIGLRGTVIKEIVLGNAKAVKTDNRKITEKPKTEWTLQDYRKHAPKELAENPKLYSDLLKLEYPNK